MQTTETFILKTIPGYDNFPISDFRNITLPSDLSLISDRLLINLYTGAMKAVHFMDRNRGDNLGNKPHALRIKDQTRQEVQTRLEAAGWEAHIVDPIAKTRDPTYIHAAGGHLAVHQVPFHDRWNLPLKDTYLYDENEHLVSQQEALRRMREDIGLPAVNINELVEDGEIDGDDLPHILALIKSLNVSPEDLHEVTDTTIQFGAQRWEWRSHEHYAEKEAYEQLIDGEFWRDAVAAGDTNRGLREWVTGVLNTDGWAHVLCTYDGTPYFVRLPLESWFDIAKEISPELSKKELCNVVNLLLDEIQNQMVYWRIE